MDYTTDQQPHVAIVPRPGKDHLNPLLQLAKKLVHHHNFSVTFIVPNDGSSMQPQKTLLSSLPNSISTIFLPPVSFNDLPEDVHIETGIILSLTRFPNSLRESFKALTESHRVVALVVDLFGVDAFEVAREFNVLPYIYFDTTAMVLSLIFHLPNLDEKYKCEYKDISEPVCLPGCVPIHGRDLVDPVQDRSNDVYKWMLYVANKYNSAAGIVVNSFMDLEPGAFKALMEDNKGFNRPKIYPIGPIIQTGSASNGEGECDCLKWLDEQPIGSVLYVCFGSGGTLSLQQLQELAMGLEASGQRFVWVVKAPNDKASFGNYFGGQCGDNPFDFLPEGFLKRTKAVGLVVPSWAPQIEVLSHSSTGGFVNHCGWNSTLESIVHGVPLIAWPLYADQRMNAVLLADDLKVALRVKVNEINGLVCKEDIANCARCLFEGEEGKVVRKKMLELKNAANKALSQDGSSTKSLAEVAKIWKNQKM